MRCAERIVPLASAARSAARRPSLSGFARSSMNALRESHEQVGIGGHGRLCRTAREFQQLLRR
jgi:hypothetical protein